MNVDSNTLLHKIIVRPDELKAEDNITVNEVVETMLYTPHNVKLLSRYNPIPKWKQLIFGKPPYEILFGFAINDTYYVIVDTQMALFWIDTFIVACEKYLDHLERKETKNYHQLLHQFMSILNIIYVIEAHIDISQWDRFFNLIERIWKNSYQFILKDNFIEENIMLLITNRAHEKRVRNKIDVIQLYHNDDIKNIFDIFAAWFYYQKRFMNNETSNECRNIWYKKDGLNELKSVYQKHIS